ncbi:(E2-independent) E3 ubiquitin-conjugating enzyme FATS [Saccopteryx leptura]|uniref:(E2-independent) E3 ubiquitin-conjugating enzyme FATS n=1 Tax=Saccopteryx leptura TaxID=249018 RepID=UPI00339BEF17
MQRPGIPAETHQNGYAARHAETAVHRTFQIKTFRTELKNHVMVMDFVRSSWFPSQRRAKVCIIRMYRGLRTAEQPAGRYEIHSGLFPSPKDPSAWERNESLSNAGLRDHQYGTQDPIALENLESDVTEKKSDCTEGLLASPNTKMISSMVISKLINEKKSADNETAPPGLCADPQPPSWPVKQCLAKRSGVTIDRAFAFLPGHLGVQTPVGERGSGAEPPPREKPCGNPQKGFASITITARRVGPPASTLVWGAVGDPLCTKCRARDPLLGDPSALAGGTNPCQHHGPATCSEDSSNSSEMRLRFPEAPAQLCDGHRYWLINADRGENRCAPAGPPAGKSPLLFSSCVHLRLSQQCPNTIYYLDRSLSVPIEKTQLAGPKMHRSVLSLNLNCSSHRLTPDGADGTANGGPIGSGLKPQLTEGGCGLLGPRWTPAMHPSLGPVPLETVACPWSGSSPLEATDFTEAGAQQVTVRKGKEDRVAPCHASVHANQLSIHIPGWSYRAGDYTCCDLVVKIKECSKSKTSAMSEPEPKPAPPPPAPCGEPESPDPQEDYFQRQQTPASAPLTLQEALEARKPQFISRSQERLRKLEHMIQQRRAQRKESPGSRQGPLPVRASKKQFTVPHPLSDNLFKPKERYIPEKEMHMRSRRIYNNLPEVKKKKEEQKKRVILQSNRLRAEVFKKQLLDQLLQRNAV